MGLKQEVRDVARFEQILNVLFKQELGYYLSQLDLVKHLPIHHRIKKHKMQVPDTKPARLRKILEELGASFVKLGQLLSLRPDLIPKEYCNEFKKLQDGVKPFSTKEARHIIQDQLGKPLHELFDSFSEEPVAAASISQVYKAKLKNGKWVAVKVQRPGIDEMFRTDIDIMYHFAMLIEKKFDIEFFDPRAIIKEFERYTDSELDFRKEAKNVEQFYKNFLGSSKVKIPRVYWAYTTEKVLTMEYIDGVHIRDIQAIKKINKKLVVKNLSDCVFKQIFEDGYFHADPHSGNVLVTRDNKVALLDFGIIGRIGDELRDQMTELCVAVIEGDLHGISESLFGLGFVETNMNLSILEQDIREELSDYYGASLEKIDFGAVMERIVDIARKDHVRLPTNFVLLIKSLVTIEGVAAQIDPSFNVVESVRPLVTRLVKERIFNVQRFKKQALISASEYGKLFKNIPKQLSSVMKNLQEGNLKIQMQDTDIHRLTLELDRSSNRLSYGMIIASLIIGSSLIVYLDKPPFVYQIPLLAIVGYGVAIFVSIILMISIAREK